MQLISMLILYPDKLLNSPVCCSGICVNPCWFLYVVSCHLHEQFEWTSLSSSFGTELSQLSTMNVILAVGLMWIAFIMLGYICFVEPEWAIVQGSQKVGYNLLWLSNNNKVSHWLIFIIEPSFWIWNESLFVRCMNFFYVLVDLISSYFVENFHLFTSKILICNVLFFGGIFV